MKVCIPPFGDYTEVIKRLGDYLGWEVIMPTSPTDRTIELGAKYSNELMCLPMKSTLGGFIEACEQGNRDFIQFDSCGECRMKAYYILQERALRKLGYDATVHPLRLGKGTPSDLRAIDPTIPRWKAWLTFFKMLRDIVRFDKKHWPSLMDESKLVKIGLVGEIFTLLEPAINRDIIKKLEKMDVLVHNSLPLSYFIFKGFYNRGWMKRDGIDRKVFLKAKKIARNYFPKEIGGHGVESIIHTIYYALKGFDGVIHILPFPCAPEACVATILDEISLDYHIPIMRLIFDVQTGEAGLITRLEAFTDILKIKKAKLLAKSKSKDNGIN